MSLQTPMMSLSAAGLPSDRFVFEGFLPAKTTARRVRLEALSARPRRDQEKHSLRLVILQEGKVSLEQHLGRISEVVGDDKLEWHFNRAREATRNTLNFGVATAVGIFFLSLIHISEPTRPY